MRYLLMVLLLLAWARPTGADNVLVTTAINRSGGEYFTCRVLNVAKKPIDVTVEVRAVTSPPPDFVSCTTQTLNVVPGRIQGVEVLTGDCGAIGPYYAIFTVKGSQKMVRAWCYAQNDPSIRAEAR